MLGVECDWTRLKALIQKWLEQFIFFGFHRFSVVSKMLTLSGK